MRKILASGRPRRLWRAAALLSLLASAAAFGQAQVKDSSIFELDSNAHDQAPAGPDWEQVAPNGVVAGGLADTFLTDSVTGDDRIFTGGGSKDVRDVSAWGVSVGEPPDKNDIEHAFAAAFDVGGDLVVYFGLDRFSTDGDSAMGFWFFKNQIQVSGGGFTGVHAVGDILVTSDNVTGGSVSEINVFEWVGGRNPLKLIASSKVGGGTTVDGVFCLTSGYACAVRNSAAVPVPTSWGGYSFKGAGSVDNFPQYAFYEGGINVSRLLGTTDRPCFASFMAMTRTSASETAQLKDFAVGAFPLCGISVTKTCAGNGVITASGDSIDYTYTATVTNTGAGTVYGVSLEESSALPGNFSTSCKIDGTSVTTGQAVEVFASLAAGQSDSVDITCNSRSGSLSNSIVARAKTSAAATTADLDAADDSDQCSTDISPGMEVTKTCSTSQNAPTGVTLVDGGFNVCVDIDVTNTSVEKLVDVHVVDNRFSNPVLVDSGTINPGATLELHDLCYTATAADGSEDTPGLAAFTNGVQAVAYGAITGQKVGDADPDSPFEATTTCKLCPCTGEGCTP